MPTIRGALRGVLFSPSLTEVTFAKRGFPIAQTTVTEQLEMIPQTVICGFEWGIEARNQWEIERRLNMIDGELRGFAVEGATMALTILDTMGRRGHRTRDLILGPGRPHIFLAYIGIGFAMARLPRTLWKKVLPDLDGSEYHPIMSWLAVDGYGFDRAYFDTRRWVDGQQVASPYSWQDAPDYFPRAVDQGVGRALWFICGASAPAIAASVGRFASERHADLWSGVGVAAAFAGGCGPDGLAALRRAAGSYWPELALGVVFAAKARTYAGLVPAATEVAATALADISVQGAARLADATRPDDRFTDQVPAYELWRRNIRDRLAVPSAALD
jgi:enediyne biosynthesis protein E2